MQSLALYRIFTLSELDIAARERIFRKSEFDLSTGCFHLCTRSQLSRTIERHFSHLATGPQAYSGLAVCSFAASEFDKRLKFEVVASAAGDNVFPHFYGDSLPFLPVRPSVVIVSQKMTTPMNYSGANNSAGLEFRRCS